MSHFRLFYISEHEVPETNRKRTNRRTKEKKNVIKISKNKNNLNVRDFFKIGNIEYHKLDTIKIAYMYNQQPIVQFDQLR